jgi:hypothetical protein
MSQQYIHHLAQELVERFGTRDPFTIAEALGVHIRMVDTFVNLKGMYRVILGERYIFLSSNLDKHTQRIVCAYVATAVKDHDGGEVTPMDFDGHPGISIADGDTGFTHKIYLSDGQLMEEYSRSDMPVNPQTASKIGETSLFEIQYISENLLEIKTDKGASYVNVRR